MRHRDYLRLFRRGRGREGVQLGHPRSQSAPHQVLAQHAGRVHDPPVLISECRPQDVVSLDEVVLRFHDITRTIKGQTQLDGGQAILKSR